MRPNLYNAEGYVDPTAYEALMNIEREAQKTCTFRPVVYICSPLSGDTLANQEAARRYCRYAVDTGYVPIAPHLFFPQFMDDADEHERNLALFMDIVLLTKCAELWVFGDHISKAHSGGVERGTRRRLWARDYAALVTSKSRIFVISLVSSRRRSSSSTQR